jgi:hypothetical protein
MIEHKLTNINNIILIKDITITFLLTLFDPLINSFILHLIFYILFYTINKKKEKNFLSFIKQ